MCLYDKCGPKPLGDCRLDVKTGFNQIKLSLPNSDLMVVCAS